MLDVMFNTSADFRGVGGGLPLTGHGSLTQANFLGLSRFRTPIGNGVDLSLFAGAGVSAVRPTGAPTGSGGPQIVGSDAAVALRVGAEIIRQISDTVAVGAQVAYQRTGGVKLSTTLPGERFDFAPRDTFLTSFTISFNPPPPVRPEPPRSTSRERPQGPRQGNARPKPPPLLGAKGPCKFAYGFFFGAANLKSIKDPEVRKEKEAEYNQAKSSAEAMTDVLKNGWGFPAFRPTINEDVTRRAILRAFDVVLEQIKDRGADEDCFVKLHFQGHGFNWGKGAVAGPGEMGPKVNPTDEHIGIEGAGGLNDTVWDYEVEDYLQKISDALKSKGKNSALIVQADFCWAEGIFGRFAEKPASNMQLAWSSSKKKSLCQRPLPNAPTPFTTGFANAFEDGKKPTVQEAHKSASEMPTIREMNPAYKSGGSESVRPSK
ncbi:hypothetical protein C2U70_32490 [Bradyrhizobium guangdongense]|nr:hypothetical protein C2U70_32490 [Bradyrhizobium guangdongense]